MNTLKIELGPPVDIAGSLLEYVTVEGVKYLREQPAPSPAPKPTRGQVVAGTIINAGVYRGNVLSIDSMRGDSGYTVMLSEGADVGEAMKSFRFYVAAAIDAERRAVKDKIADYLDAQKFVASPGAVRDMPLD